MSSRFYRVLLLIGVLAVVGLTTGAGQSEKRKMLQDLRGEWRFEIGDDRRWAEPEFDDSQWATVRVPAYWEDEGFPGYDGPAWYRTRFKVPLEWKGKSLYLDLGQIDDADQVFLNGSFIAFSGNFPPHYTSAYSDPRFYAIPQPAIRYGQENTMAVRVYDQHLGGGIARGTIGIFEDQKEFLPDMPLAGTWKYATGDDPDRSRPEFDDRKWQKVYVPAYWETYGDTDHDGFAWYRTKFSIPRNLSGTRLILLLGRIDDLDETYLNGKRIGRTGTITLNDEQYIRGDEYNSLRAYTIPPEILNSQGENTLAVRVYDGRWHGGIYRGPIGLATRERFLAWQRDQPDGDKGSWWQKTLDFILK